MASVCARAVPTCGDRLWETASSMPAASSGEPPATINSSSCRDRAVVRSTQLDELARCVKPSRLGELVVAGSSQQRAGNLFAQKIERPAAPEARQPDQGRPRGRRQLDRQAFEGSLHPPCRAGPACPWASRGQALEGSLRSPPARRRAVRSTGPAPRRLYHRVPSARPPAPQSARISGLAGLHRRTGQQALQERRVILGCRGRGGLGQPNVAERGAVSQGQHDARRPPPCSRVDRPGRGRLPSEPEHPGRAGDRPRRSHSPTSHPAARPGSHCA